MTTPLPRTTLFPYTTLFRSVASWTMDRLERLGAKLYSAPGLVPGLLGGVLFVLSIALAVRALRQGALRQGALRQGALRRSEEHTSELQSQSNLVCRLLLEKK